LLPFSPEPSVIASADEKLKNYNIQDYNFAYVYGCETWSLALREELTLRVFENRVLRRIFGLKTDEVMGGWRKLRNENIHYLYSSPSIIRIIKSRRMRWMGRVDLMEKEEERV
jgi:hypothetical protein